MGKFQAQSVSEDNLIETSTTGEMWTCVKAGAILRTLKRGGLGEMINLRRHGQENNGNRAGGEERNPGPVSSGGPREIGAEVGVGGTMTGQERIVIHIQLITSIDQRNGYSKTQGWVMTGLYQEITDMGLDRDSI